MRRFYAVTVRGCYYGRERETTYHLEALDKFSAKTDAIQRFRNEHVPGNLSWVACELVEGEEPSKYQIRPYLIAWLEAHRG